MKSKRDKNNKHFNKVGFAGDLKKNIPHWASNDTEIIKIKAWQKEHLDP